MLCANPQRSTKDRPQPGLVKKLFIETHLKAMQQVSTVSTLFKKTLLLTFTKTQRKISRFAKHLKPLSLIN